MAVLRRSNAPGPSAEPSLCQVSDRGNPLLDRLIKSNRATNVSDGTMPIGSLDFEVPLSQCDFDFSDDRHGIPCFPLSQHIPHGSICPRFAVSERRITHNTEGFEGAVISYASRNSRFHFDPLYNIALLQRA